ncbi:MAG TPA: hypothetical protein PK566_13890 [Pseudobacteroides sp.]|nr:hypothetical protein [Pseudobacteroides sp.]
MKFSSLQVYSKIAPIIIVLGNDKKNDDISKMMILKKPVKNDWQNNLNMLNA